MSSFQATVAADRLLARESTIMTHSFTTVAAKFSELSALLEDANARGNGALMEGKRAEVRSAMNLYLVEIMRAGAVEIASLNGEVADIEGRRGEIDREVEKKERAFQLLLASVEDLKRMLAEEGGDA
ncbi:hypothetical protein TeGR_g14761 [Tetraparma gracilis]|uniref:Uncharacterized protein n=1 Tax=Tetraparma gracilis TaxID=2962635 RepID=A0ABQ6MA48_9STRA|nr:hypothetical protein TeGR_g14761 [Tetraparma gracilis]